jgi:thiol-disulfide isomerase/thioredoxin
MFPVLEKLDEKYSEKIIIIKVNASDPKFQDLILEDFIRAVPTFIIKKEGSILACGGR